MAEPQYRGVTVDTRVIPLASILQHVAGSSWEVNFYSQVVDTNSELGPQQLNVQPAFQQYCLIQGMELKVITPLQQEQDSESKSMIITGQAITYPGFIPNKGDMFLADIGDGREGIFTVTSAEKKTHLKDSYYEISYEVVSYSDTAPDRRADLGRKTIRTVKFVRDFLLFGQNPQIVESEYTQREEMQVVLAELIGYYFHDFFSIEKQTLLVPGQADTTYDPFLTAAVVELISTEEHPYLARIRLPNVMGQHANAMPTIWDCLLKMSYAMLYTAMQQTRLVNTIYYKTMPHYSGIYFTGIERVVYPFDERTDVDVSYGDVCEVPMESAGLLEPGGRRFTDFTRLMPGGNLNGFNYTLPQDQQLPDIIRVTEDPYYIFSQSFYKNETPLKSNLERVVLQALKQEPLDKVAILRMAKNAIKWENVERFYYIPMLFALLKVAIRTN